MSKEMIFHNDIEGQKVECMNTIICLDRDGSWEDLEELEKSQELKDLEDEVVVKELHQMKDIKGLEKAVKGSFNED